MPQRGLLYVCVDGGSDSCLVAMRPVPDTSGNRHVWALPGGPHIRARVSVAVMPPDASGNPVVLFASGDTTTGKGLLQALDRETGAVLGHLDLPSIPRCMVLDVTCRMQCDQQIFISFDDGSVRALAVSSDGPYTVAWQTSWVADLGADSTGAHHALALGDMSLAGAGGGADASGNQTSLWFGSDAQLLYALDAKSGKLLLETTLFTGAGQVRAAPAIVEGLSSVNQRIYVSSDDGYVYALDVANSVALALKWKQRIASAARPMAPTCPYGISAPVFLQRRWVGSSGTVYVGSYDGYVLGLDAADGTILLQSAAIVPAGISTPLLSADGEDLYVSASVPCSETPPTTTQKGSIAAIKVRNVCDPTVSNVCPDCAKDYLDDQEHCDKCVY